MKEIEFFKLGLYEGEIGSDALARKKEFGHIMTQTRKRAKGDRCLHCNEKKSSFCNSHSVPAFCLRNISSNGYLYYSNTLINIPLLDEEKGVKNAGTFQIICKECDSTIFQEYENPDNYENDATPKMLAQIAMKNFLRHIGNRTNDHALYEIIGEKNPFALDFIRNMHSIQDVEIDEYKRNYDKAKRLSKLNCNGEYYQFYHQKLDYVVPLAFQGSIALVTDLDGEIVNDIYFKERKYSIQNLHICIFPLKDTSIVMMFIDSSDDRYEHFCSKFNELPNDDKLSLINYIIFLYSEDVFLSKEIPENILKDKKLVEVSQLSSIAFLNFSNSIDDVKKIYDLSKYREIPNLLSEKYKLR